MTGARVCGSPSHSENGHGTAYWVIRELLPVRHHNSTDTDAVRNGESNGLSDNC